MPVVVGSFLSDARNRGEGVKFQFCFFLKVSAVNCIRKGCVKNVFCWQWFGLSPVINVFLSRQVSVLGCLSLWYHQEVSRERLSGQKVALKDPCDSVTMRQKPIPTGAYTTAFAYGCFPKYWYPHIIHFNSSIINHPFWGTPIFENTHVYIVTMFAPRDSCGLGKKDDGERSARGNADQWRCVIFNDALYIVDDIY